MIPGRIYAKDSSVKLKDAEPELLEGLAALGRLYGRFGLPCVVTSLNDAKHREGSLHYAGKAADIRTKNVPRDRLDELVRAAKFVLDEARWDVILEQRDGAGEHLHVEIDPAI